MNTNDQNFLDHLKQCDDCKGGTLCDTGKKYTAALGLPEDSLAGSAMAALPEMNADGSLPDSIQVFPPGKNVPFTLAAHPGKLFHMDVDESVAAKANADLQEMIAAAAKNQGPKPFADKNHEDAEATFHPTRFFYAGEDKVLGGVRVNTPWTGVGEPLVKARAFSYFSGNFLFNPQTKKFLGLLGPNIGGLVNRPGFATQQAFAKADASTQPQPKTNMITKEELLASLAEGLKPLTTRLETLEANAKAASTVKADDTVIVALETRLKKIEADATTSIEASAKADVNDAVRLGKIASQDADGVTWWTNQLTAEAKAGKTDAKVRLQKLPVNPAFLTVVAAQAAGATGDKEPTRTADVWEANRK